MKVPENKKPARTRVQKENHWPIFWAQFWTVQLIIGPALGIKTAFVGESFWEYIGFFLFGVAFVTPIAAIAGGVAVVIHRRRLRQLGQSPGQAK
jgi:hypothetical protein